jgi:hypothetical protein
MVRTITLKKETCGEPTLCYPNEMFMRACKVNILQVRNVFARKVKSETDSAQSDPLPSHQVFKKQSDSPLTADCTSSLPLKALLQELVLSFASIHSPISQ